jgi:hypothetical protein
VSQSRPPPDSLQRLAGRVGGLQAWQNDRAAAEAQLADARRAFDAKFESEQARKLHYARMALKSAQARARRRREDSDV